MLVRPLELLHELNIKTNKKLKKSNGTISKTCRPVHRQTKPRFKSATNESYTKLRPQCKIL